MAYSPHAQSNGSSETSGGKKPAGGLLVFVKKITRLLSRTKKTVVTLRVKRDIRKLERERSKERTNLLSQRRFYERFLRRNNNVPAEVENNIKPKIVVTEPKVPKNNPNFEARATFVNQIQELPEITKPEVESVLEAPVYQIPNSQDIQPILKKPEVAIKKEVISEAPATPIIPPVIEKVKENVLIKPVEKTVPSSVISENQFNLFLRKASKKIISLFSFSSLAKKLALERAEEAAVKDKNEVEGRFFQPYNGVKANLIKDQGVLFFNWQQKILTLSLSIILCCLAISLSYVGLLIWQKEKLNDNKATLANFDVINIEVVKSENDLKEITGFNQKLDIVSSILNNHVYWTNFFNFLENNTLKDVYYESFSGDLSGKYKIPSIARNLNAISLQLEVMKAYNMIKTVQYSSAQSGTDSKSSSTPPASNLAPALAENPNKTTTDTVKFNLEMTIDPKIFIK